MFLSSNYMGDLVSTRYPALKEGEWGGGLFLRRDFTERFSLRLNAAYGQFKGADANFPEQLGVRGFSFKGSATDLSLLGEWDLLGKRRYNKGNFKKTRHLMYFYLKILNLIKIVCIIMFVIINI
jgi:hypothetical protein